ncbi:hypothetical protein [Pedobacter sp.]|jgi:hypothetical protein|uniref:hypothetical protein n=1 Tax=Pedobacter sp. TaxID=1411316 RepID=UPI002C2ECE3B|nr:hypothetical protein [Pedobacter sp.]HWW39582.1 hypothetical protein [Pedobacter sp.]
MKKYISIALTALLALTLSSCSKKADIAGIEPKLPNLQLSSLGYQQSSPFTLTTILQVYFGATAKVPTGKFVVDILEGNTVVKTVTFSSWNGYDATSTDKVTNHTITYTLQDTTYPNTKIYAGSILLKFSALGLSVDKTYALRASAYAADGTTVSTMTQSGFFKTIAPPAAN